MKNTTIVALVLGLLIAIMPTVLAFQPLEKVPPYGQAKKTSVLSGGKGQYWTARADVEYRPSHYGTKYGGEGMRKAIKFERSPPGYRASVQKGLKSQQGKSAVATMKTVSGMPGASAPSAS